MWCIREEKRERLHLRGDANRSGVVFDFLVSSSPWPRVAGTGPIDMLAPLNVIRRRCLTEPPLLVEMPLLVEKPVREDRQRERERERERNAQRVCEREKERRVKERRVKERRQRNV